MNREVIYRAPDRTVYIMKMQNSSGHGYGVGGWRTEVSPSGEERQSGKKIVKRGRYCSHLQKFCTTPGLTQQHWGLFPRGEKRLGREAHHSPPYRAEVKNV
jgi:hypothetical protein